ncbi:MAG TPA: TetR/AcrR family transcriptional regulator [Gemmatimonadaceae bacterium]|nr:TetR/AcrR family transcriptional regulator [Gemmatimonadaceae bacterium]
MRKGEATRQAILDRATDLASKVGLTGLTIGHLAEDLDLSKSGLFAHFQSKEALQIQVLEHGAASFVERVVRPALAQPRGIPRLRAVFEGWLAWDSALPGGCVFVAAASELDDREGPVRDRLVELQRQWVDFITTSFRRAIDEGHVASEADPAQLSQDLYGIMLVWHHHSRLLGDREAERRARHAFDALLAAAAPREPRPS